VKKLTPRHREAIRRLVAGENNVEVAEEMGISPQTVSNWMQDPKFLSELHEVEERALARLTDSEARLDALKIIQDAAGKAAQLCSDAVENGTVGADAISPTLRIRSAWDILDRSGYKAVEKQQTEIYDIADLIRLAEERYNKERNGPKPVGSRSNLAISE
jgi:transcriptional regulator with XRE-family HTH domain